MPSLWSLRGTYFAFFFANSSFFTYSGLYFATLGFSGVQVGTLAAVGPLVALGAQPFWGWLSDTRFGTLISLRAVLIGAAALAPLFLLAGSFWALFALTAALFFFASSCTPLMDATALGALGNRPDAYGRIRLFGSFGFTLGVLILGFALQRLPLNTFFWWYAGAALVAALTTLGVSAGGAGRSARTALRGRSPAGELLRDRRVLGLLAFIWLVQLSLGGGSAFLGIFARQMGGDNLIVGLVAMIASFCCWPFFWFGETLLVRIGAPRLLLAGASCYVLRWVLTAQVHEPWQLILVQMLHGPAFVLTFASGVSLMNRWAPEGAKARAQSLYTATYGSLGNIAGGLIAGWLWDWGGATHLYLGMAVAAILAGGLWWPLLGRFGRP
ncbi:MAG TPA: MFS transporter, partial [Limnochordia bacterium]|nr:MFS transporter [Limnochordia bacterium]